jgi:hypothetical protein
VVITWEQLENEFGQIANRSLDLSPVTRAGGIMAAAEIKERFNTQTDPDGHPWIKPRFPRPEGGGLVLLNHGILRASYTSESGPDWFRAGTSDKRAKPLHFGATIRPVNKQWLTIPLTREAVYAGRAPNQPGLHFRQKRGKDVAGLYDSDGKRHWLLVKEAHLPSRRQVGLSVELAARFRLTLSQFLLMGKL